MLTTPVCLHMDAGCCPQPPTGPHSNKAGRCGRGENHNSKPHTVPTASSSKQMTSSPGASAENTRKDWELAGPGTRERKEIMATAEEILAPQPDTPRPPQGRRAPASPAPPSCPGNLASCHGTALVCDVENKTKGTIHHIFQQLVSFLCLEEKLGHHKAKFFLKKLYIFFLVSK